MSDPTEVERERMLTYGKFLTDYIPPCPWNPFPHDSVWGRKIEADYRADKLLAQRKSRSGDPS